ncbi:Precorrin-6Y C5,15-methyltransferase (Decarboxylating) [uncultured delta proteobacterium]|uniref:Precorrin-6Y C5,15-methyltransferase (Decarboxylating) n=1 Tax=uncultured delta proteobacterium TaxID=34034 RepID=A0A212J9E5_9DELT|nr:Precorrin-6Y C5,15-methyltransferase (Decarboxylating) [uncultured delta proteobacterium]
MVSDNCITLIGTGMDHNLPGLAAHPGLAGADIVIGSKPVLEALGTVPARKITVRTPVADLLDEAAALLEQGKRIAVLANGDPLFHSIGVSFMERFGADACRVYPALSSLQTAAAALRIPWHDIVTVSAHGRTGFLPLAHAAMRGAPVCLLTDSINTPGKAAHFLLTRGLTGFTARVAAKLGSEDVFLWQGELTKAAGHTFPDPAVIFFLPDPALPAPRPLCPGQPEAAFAREGALITKWPVRAAALAALRIEPRHVVWDLGAGSGSVSIEAAALAHCGHVVAVEREETRARHIEENRRRFGAANLDILHAAMPGCLEEGYAVPRTSVTDGSLQCGNALPGPDRIFLGGGLGGGAEEAARIIRLAWRRLLPGGRLVASCVLLEDLALARAAMSELDGAADVTLVQAATAAPLGSGTHLRGINPVFLIAAQKSE